MGYIGAYRRVSVAQIFVSANRSAVASLTDGTTCSIGRVAFNAFAQRIFFPVG
jgi:hypothetical protein